MRILILFLLSVLMGATAVGQQKMLTPEDAAGLNRSLIPQRLRNLGWVHGTHDFAYIGLPQKSINSLYRVDKQTFEC